MKKELQILQLLFIRKLPVIQLQFLNLYIFKPYFFSVFLQSYFTFLKCTETGHWFKFAPGYKLLPVIIPHGCIDDVNTIQVKIKFAFVGNYFFFFRTGKAGGRMESCRNNCQQRQTWFLPEWCSHHQYNHVGVITGSNL